MNENLALIIIIAFAVVAIIAFALMEKLDSAIAGTIFIIAAIGLFVTYAIYLAQEHDRNMAEVQNQIDTYWNDIDTKAETYKILLDGKEVDKDDIDIHLYSISVNDEKQTIYITNK